MTRSNPFGSHFDGYYDDHGNWRRMKYCFAPCRVCTCKPPFGSYYSRQHDKYLESRLAEPHLIARKEFTTL